MQVKEVNTMLSKNKLELLEKEWLNYTGLELAKILEVSPSQVFYYATKLGLSKQRPKLELTGAQESLLIGSMLGDGNIKKNGKTGAYFRTGNTDKEYVEWKANIMSGLISNGGIICVPARKGNQKEQYWFSTKTYQELPAYNLISNIELLSRLDNTSFTIWLLDDGWATCRRDGTRGQMCIACNRFSEEERAYAIVQLARLGLQAKSIGIKNKNISISSSGNDLVKSIVFSVLPRDTDIVSRKIVPLI